MAQEKDKKKPKRTPRSKNAAAEEKPYVEQFSELLMVHNKNDPKAGLGVVSRVNGKGNCKTVPPDEKNENSFLKFDKNSRILEFFSNFRKEFSFFSSAGTVLACPFPSISLTACTPALGSSLLWTNSSSLICST